MFNHVLQKTQILLLSIWLLFMYLSLSPPPLLKWVAAHWGGVELWDGWHFRLLDFLNKIYRCRVVCTPSSSESSKTIRQGIRMWTKNNTANESQTAVLRFFHWNTLYSSHKYKYDGTKILRNVYLFDPHTCMPLRVNKWTAFWGCHHVSDTIDLTELTTAWAISVRNS